MSEYELWTGARRADGYGTIGRHGLAHRVAWEEEVGPIPKGSIVHHVCENPACINIDHLALTTQSEHARSHGYIAKATAASQAAKRAATHCTRGHEFTPANTYWTRLGRRNCRACRTELRRGSI